MRRIESILLVIITLLLVLVVDKYESKDLNDLINDFENDVANEEVLKQYYVDSHKVYVKEENRAGRVGQSISSGIEDTANLVIILFDEIMGDILR
ncbi:MAG: hypothetical protein IKM20_03880 [Erysipelotrichales bacterium]|nr:hypothetical protein [Erysipelotrichales bacterium]